MGSSDNSWNRSPKGRIPTLPEDEIDEPWYEAIEIGYAWLTGFRPDVYWENTTACFDRMTNYTFLELPALKEKLADEAIDNRDKFNETLYVVRNLTEGLWFCNSAWNSSNYFFWERRQAYNNFGHLLLSILQNFLGEVISLSNIYLSIEENMALNNTYGVHYDSARIVRILTIFEPVELIEQDFDFDFPDTDDADTIPDPDANQ